MAILKQVVDLQETVKRLMEQNDKLHRELNATRCELYRQGDLRQICKHWNNPDWASTCCDVNCEGCK